MKTAKLFIPIFLFIAIAFQVPHANAGDTQKDINSYCKQKWSSDYEMQQYCIEQMREGWGKVSSFIERYGKQGEEYKIIGRCWNKWYPQMDMVAYCSENQISAYNSMKSEETSGVKDRENNIESDIREHCTNKWSSDFEMQKYCMSQMNEALQELSQMISHYGKNSEEYQIIGRCWSKWYPQFDMIVYCSNNQISAYESIR